MKTSLNKLGFTALTRLTKVLGATVHEPDQSLEQILSSTAEYLDIYLWDWEYGLVKIVNPDPNDKIGTAVLGAITYEVSDYRTETSRFSHICIHLKVIQRVYIYRSDVDKVVQWEEDDKLTDEQYYARPEHHR